MTLQNLIIIYYITLGLSAFNVVLLLFEKHKLINYVGTGIVICSALSIIGVRLVSGHFPVYEKFATLPNMVFVLSLLGVIYNRKTDNKVGNINAVWCFVFALLLYILTKDFATNSNYYMYDKAYVVLFFQFRIIAIAFLIFAMANQVSVFFFKNNKEFTSELMHRARNYTLLGAAFYLLGECSGSYWCFLWFGDPWHWSKGFFLASAMFLLTMIGSHLPAKYFQTINKKAFVSLSATTVIFIIYLISH